jgi:hypothetical protein
MNNKHFKAKQDYGCDIIKMPLKELKMGRGTALEQAPRLARFARFYTLLEQELEHPILVLGDQLYNGGLRVMVAVEKGYEYIDAIVSDDIKLLESLRVLQRKDAHRFFPKEELERSEREGQ